MSIYNEVDIEPRIYLVALFRQLNRGSLIFVSRCFSLGKAALTTKQRSPNFQIRIKIAFFIKNSFAPSMPKGFAHGLWGKPKINWVSATRRKPL